MQSNIQLSEAILAQPFNEPLVHQVVVAYQAGTRAPTADKKNRAAVSGGGRKPWRQKGTGRARAGTSSSPIWRGGGVTFASKTKDYSQKVNRKMYRGAMRSIFAELVRQQRLLVVDEFSVKTLKTRDMLAKLKEFDTDEALIITTEVDQNLYYASRNLPKVAVVDVAQINPVILLRFAKVIITAAALKRVEELIK